MWGQGQQGGNQGFGQLTKSDHFGGMGGAFSDFGQNSNLSLVAVRGGAGSLIDRVQFLFIDINTGQYVESPVYGGQGGAPFMYQAPPGQYITDIWVTHGALVNRLRFGTNQGVTSDTYGNDDANHGHFHTNGRITGV